MQKQIAHIVKNIKYLKTHPMAPLSISSVVRLYLTLEIVLILVQVGCRLRTLLITV